MQIGHASATSPATSPTVLHVLHAWDDACEGGAPRSPALGSRNALDRCDAAIIAVASAIRTLPHVRHRVLVLGGTAAAKRVQALGISTFHRIAPPVQRPSLAARTFALHLETFGSFDAVHLWGESLLSIHPWHEKVKRVVVTDTMSGRTRIVGEWEDPSHATTAGDTLPVPSLCPAQCASLQELRSRERERAGLRERDIAIALLADPPGEAEIARFTFMATMLRVSGLSSVAVLNSCGHEGERGLTPWRVEMLGARPITSTRPLALALPMCDIAVFAPGSRFATTPSKATWRDQCLARVALDLRIPIVTASRDLLPGDFSNDAAQSMLAHSPHPAGFARVIRRLAETDSGQRRVVTPPPSTDAAFVHALDRVWRA